MSRSRKALTLAAFTYAQSTLGLLASLYVTRLLVSELGRDVYGVWQASGQLLAYAALADLGIFGVMPWLFAEADGAKDDAKKRSLVAHGLVIGAVSALIYTAIATLLWFAFPTVIRLTDAEKPLLWLPIMTLAGLTAVGYPLRLFVALRNGVQDFKFAGALGVAQTLLTAGLTVLLVHLGFGLVGVAVGLGLPPALSGIAALVRSKRDGLAWPNPWPKLDRKIVRNILGSGVGTWLATLGWQLAFASDSAVLAQLGHRDTIPTFVVTSRLGITLMQLAWALPDSASVGLAQLGAESADRSRVRDVVLTLVELNLFLAGGVAIVVLAMNGAFVGLWMGRDFFGGFMLNSAFAAAVLALSLVHALFVPAAVLGKRGLVGAVTLVNGAAHIGLALWLGRTYALTGVAAATALSSVGISLPVGIWLVRETAGVGIRQLARDALVPWAWRALPIFGLAALSGSAIVGGLAGDGKIASALVGALTALILGTLYLFVSRNAMQRLPFPEKARKLLERVRLLRGS